MHIQQIDNLTVLSEVMPSSETVAVNILVKTGSRHENAEINGISHFLEHMAFKGTARRTAAQIAEEFDMIGGNFNAYTSRDKTVYYAKVLKEDIEIALDILSDIVQHSVLDAQEIEKERKVILEELAQVKDTPDDHIFDLFQEKLFENQALGQSIIGPEENIQKINKEDLSSYINSRYGRNNVIISCAGNFDRSHFESNVAERFSALPKYSENTDGNAQYTGGEVRLEKDLEQIHLVVGFSGVSYLDKDFYTQRILSIILGGGMSSRLFQEVREKRGLAYHISTFCSNHQDVGAFAIYSSTNSININELIEVTAEQFHKAAKSIEINELKRAKAQVKAGLLMAQESSSARSDRMASTYATFGKLIPLQDLIATIEDISVEDVRLSLASILKNEKLPTVAAIGKLNELMHYDQIRHLFKV